MQTADRVIIRVVVLGCYAGRRVFVLSVHILSMRQRRDIGIIIFAQERLQFACRTRWSDTKSGREFLKRRHQDRAFVHHDPY